MKKFIIALLSFTGLLFAHENWLMTDQFITAPGETVTVYLCGGHYFPESGFAVKDKLVYKTYFIAPGGDTTAFKTTVDGRRRRGEITIAEKGTYQVVAVLKRPQKKEPEYWTKAVIVSGGKTEPVNYASGKGLEIVPETGISKLNPGDSLPLRILYNNTPVKGTVSVSIDGKKNFTRKTDGDGRTILTIKRSGTYMLYVTRGAQGSSLTFYIGE